MKHRYVLALCALFLSGCASKVVKESDAKYASADRIFAYQTKHPDDAFVTVVRDWSMTGAGCYASITVDGNLAAKLGTSEKVDLYFPAGEKVVGVALEGGGLCALNPARQERYVETKPNQHKVLRAYTSNSGDLDILPTTVQ